MRSYSQSQKRISACRAPDMSYPEASYGLTPKNVVSVKLVLAKAGNGHPEILHGFPPARELRMRNKLGKFTLND